MTVNKSKKGDIVTIYEDPVTCQRPEGKAKLEIFEGTIALGVIDGRKATQEMWSVEFVDDPGRTYIRSITTWED